MSAGRHDSIVPSDASVAPQALAHPTLFTFGELLELELIQKAEEEKKVLSIFAYGTWNEYKKAGRCLGRVERRLFI